MLGLLDAAGRPAGVDVSFQGRDMHLSWNGGTAPNLLVAAISDLVGSSPTYQSVSDDGLLELWGWHFFGLVIRWQPSNLLVGLAGIAAALAGPCVVCQDRWAEVPLEAFDYALHIEKGDKLQSHQQLRELDDLIGGVEEMAELLGALTQGAKFEQVTQALCQIGHLSGLAATSKALS